jgi:AraC-like DNA-binding protein
MKTMSFIPAEPLMTEDASWESIAGTIERQLLPRVDEMGAALFLPSLQPMPTGACVAPIQDFPTKVWRNQYPEMMFLVGGQAQVIRAGQWLHLRAGQGVFFPINVPYAGHASVNGQVLNCDCLWFGIHAFGVIVHRCHLMPKSHRSSIHYILSDARLADIFGEWVASVSELEKQNALCAKGFLLAFFSLLLRSPFTPLRAVTPRIAEEELARLPLPLQQAVQMIHRSYDKPFRLAQVARSCSVSPYYLCRLFRQHLQTTPLGYLTLLRLKTAQRLLERTDVSIADVASLVGYNNLPHFTRLFTRTFGAPPSASRQGVARRRHVPVFAASKR